MGVLYGFGSHQNSNVSLVQQGEGLDTEDQSERHPILYRCLLSYSRAKKFLQVQRPIHCLGDLVSSVASMIYC